MDVNTLFSNLKCLQGNVSWNITTVQEIVLEVAVISKNPTSDTVLPLVLAVLDKAKAAALEKVPQGKSSDEVAQMFDELKVLAKHLVPVLLSAGSVEVAKLENVVKSSGCFAWLCASGAAVSKAIDQTAQQLEKVDDIVAPVEVALTGNSNVAQEVSAVAEKVQAVAQNLEAVPKKVSEVAEKDKTQ